MVGNGPAAISELMDLGLEFDGGNTQPELGLEGGHCEHRVLHINGDQTGKGLELFMKKIATEQKNIRFFEKTYMREILLEKDSFAGICAIGKEENFSAGSVVVATGGYAGVFEKTTNPKTTVGSGIAIAARAGCALDGMEFVQFHPTTLRAEVGGNFLVSEAVRGEGGKIVDESGKSIINPLDTRDKVSIAIYSEIIKGQKVFLDATGFEAGFFKERFPSVYSELKSHGMNPEKDPIPIETAAHYTIGGVKTDIEARATLKRVYAAGECACSGLHGANRLASNSLLEGLVMGKVAGANAAKEKIGKAKKGRQQMLEREGTPTKTAFEAIKKIMWRCCGVVRQEANLKDGLSGIKKLENKIEVQEAVENIVVRNALLVSRKTIDAALEHKESIGVHYRIN